MFLEANNRHGKEHAIDKVFYARRMLELTKLFFNINPLRHYSIGIRQS